jgi:hypothetical protein
MCADLFADFAAPEDQADAAEMPRHNPSPSDASVTVDPSSASPTTEQATGSAGRQQRSRFGRYLAFVRERRRADGQEEGEATGRSSADGGSGRRNRRERAVQMGPGPF